MTLVLGKVVTKPVLFGNRLSARVEFPGDTYKQVYWTGSVNNILSQIREGDQVYVSNSEVLEQFQKQSFLDELMLRHKGIEKYRVRVTVVAAPVNGTCQVSQSLTASSVYGTMKFSDRPLFNNLRVGDVVLAQKLIDGTYIPHPDDQIASLEEILKSRSAPANRTAIISIPVINGKQITAHTPGGRISWQAEPSDLLYFIRYGDEVEIQGDKISEMQTAKLIKELSTRREEFQSSKKHVEQIVFSLERDGQTVFRLIRGVNGYEEQVYNNGRLQYTSVYDHDVMTAMARAIIAIEGVI